jgi:1,4-dihydroxy-2-naphthoate octaprenyltransferase
VVIGVVSMFLAYGYTGGPFPLAYLGLGELFVILFFGLVAVMGTVFIQTGEWTGQAALLGLVVGGLSALLITINNLRDVEEDAKTGKKTLAVRLGWKLARLAVIDELLLVLVPLFFLLRVLGLGGGLAGWCLQAFLLVAGGGLVVKVITTRPSALYNRFLMLAGLLMVAFAVGWTLVVMG